MILVLTLHLLCSRTVSFIWGGALCLSLSVQGRVLFLLILIGWNCLSLSFVQGRVLFLFILIGWDCLSLLFVQGRVLFLLILIGWNCLFSSFVFRVKSLFENLQILSFVLRDVVSLSRIVFLMLRLSGFSSLFVLKRCCQSVLRFGAWCLVVDYFSSFSVCCW